MYTGIFLKMDIPLLRKYDYGQNTIYFRLKSSNPDSLGLPLRGYFG